MVHLAAKSRSVRLIRGRFGVHSISSSYHLEFVVRTSYHSRFIRSSYNEVHSSVYHHSSRRYSNALAEFERRLIRQQEGIITIDTLKLDGMKTVV